MQEMINRAKELLSDGTVNRVLGWRRGDMSYNPEPSYFETAEDLDANFVYNGFCGANLSKYMIEAEKKRVSRWRIETLYDKLVEKGLTLSVVTDYTKHQITEVWLNQFIKELESTV